MANRYGWDELNTLLFVASFLLRLAGSHYGNAYWSRGALVLLFMVLFRAYSRERGKRRKENGAFFKCHSPGEASCEAAQGCAPLSLHPLPVLQ